MWGIIEKIFYGNYKGIIGLKVLYFRTVFHLVFFNITTVKVNHNYVMILKKYNTDCDGLDINEMNHAWKLERNYADDSLSCSSEAP